MNVYFSYASGRSQEDGKFFVDDNSSLYGLADGEKFEVRYNPKSPSTYYSEGAQSLSMTIYRVIVGVGTAFAALVVIAQILAHR